MESIALCSNIEYVDFYNNDRMFNSPQSMGSPTAEVNQLNRTGEVPDYYGWWGQVEQNLINHIFSLPRPKSNTRGVNTPLQCSLRMVLKYKEREREREREYVHVLLTFYILLLSYYKRKEDLLLSRKVHPSFLVKGG